MHDRMQMQSRHILSLVGTCDEVLHICITIKAVNILLCVSSTCPELDVKLVR